MALLCAGEIVTVSIFISRNEFSTSGELPLTGRQCVLWSSLESQNAFGRKWFAPQPNRRAA
jgi:hypothetical protein